MKFSTAALLLSSALLAATSSAVKPATSSAVKTSTHPCLDIDTLVFPTCKVPDIVATITAALGALDPLDACPHNERTEVKLLAGTDRYGFAKKVLRARCRAGGDVRVPCTDWTDVVIGECTLAGVQGAVADKIAALGGTCKHDATEELKILTGSRNSNQARKYIKAACNNAWLGVEQSKYRVDVDRLFNKNFMDEYTEGLTFLNVETGNFQDAPDDPTDQEEYPTEGTLTRTVGANIASFQEDGNNNSVLQKVRTLTGCENQAMMCCFGRDRQVDNDGNCANGEGNCKNADPGDNSNLCKIGDVAFPGEEEGDIHCHGTAWSSDPNDSTAQLRYNNWFYISMYDHMYKRGYVEQLLAGNDAAITKLGSQALPPMCGCIEDMPVVTRSDCTQIDATQDFKFNLDDDMLLYSEPEGDLDVQFNACEGIDFDDGTAANNDLASYVNRLHADELLSEDTRSKIFQHLVGYAEPGDNENEGRCEDAL